MTEIEARVSRYLPRVFGKMGIFQTEGNLEAGISCLENLSNLCELEEWPEVALVVLMRVCYCDARVFKRLKEKQIQILAETFWGRKQCEIAERVGLKQPRVSRILSSCVGKIRTNLTNAYLGMLLEATRNNGNVF